MGVLVTGASEESLSRLLLSGRSELAGGLVLLQLGEMWSIFVKTGSILALCTAEEGLERAPLVLSGETFALLAGIGDQSWLAGRSALTGGLMLLAFQREKMMIDRSVWNDSSTWIVSFAV